MFEPLPEVDDRHDYFTIVTLIDITASDASRHYHKGMEDSVAYYNIIRNQRRNFDSFMQSIGLRCQPMYISDAIAHFRQDLSAYDFGTNYTTATIWSFNFGVEHKGIYDLPSQPHGGLLNDLHNVPIIVGLLETVSIKPAIIDTATPERRNTIILK